MRALQGMTWLLTLQLVGEALARLRGLMDASSMAG